MELKGSVPEEVFRQIGNARIVPETLSLNKVLEEYYTFKCEDAAQDLPLKGRIARIRKDLVIVLGKNRVDFTDLKDITRADANIHHALRTLRFTKASSSSNLRNTARYERYSCEGYYARFAD